VKVTFQTKAVGSGGWLWGGGGKGGERWRRSWHYAHAHWVGTRLKTGSYAARCGKRAGRVRLVQRPVHRRTDPGTTRPGRRLTGVHSETLPGDNAPARKPRRKAAKRAVNDPLLLLPLISPLLLSPPPQEKHRGVSDVAAKRVGFIPAVLFVLFVSTVNTPEQRPDAAAAGFTMVLLGVRDRRRLRGCCVGTLCLQLLLWILCAVNGEEQPFSVEVRSTGTAIG